MEILAHYPVLVLAVAFVSLFARIGGERLVAQTLFKRQRGAEG
jgi:hypothetical protein